MFSLVLLRTVRGGGKSQSTSLRIGAEVQIKNVPSSKSEIGASGEVFEGFCLFSPLKDVDFAFNSSGCDGYYFGGALLVKPSNNDISPVCTILVFLSGWF